MIIVPFFNHYSSGLGTTLNKVFNVRGIRVDEYPCLCDPIAQQVSSPLALFHGISSREAKEDFRCYDRSRRVMLQNPNTTYYVWGVNPCMKEGYRELVTDERLKPTNCKVIRIDNLLDTVEEITRLMKKIAGK